MNFVAAPDDDDEAVEEVPAGDQQELEPDNEHQYNRLLNLCRRTRADIKARKISIEEMIKSGESSFVTDSEQRMRNIKVRSSIKTINEEVRLYKEYNRDLTKICAHTDIEPLTRDLTEVLDAANDVICLYDASQELEKSIEQSSNAASIRNLSIEKYRPTGIDRFIKFNSFMEEFTENVLSKPLKPLIKLNYLKSSVTGEAKELLAKYTLGSQLSEALTSLENQYSKPEFVLAEIYRSLKGIPSINSFRNNIQKAKEQVNILKIAVCTLKSLGYEKELLDDATLQNTWLLVDVEGKIPIDVYFNWSEEKRRIKTSLGRNPNIEEFTNYYEKVVDTQYDALYLRDRLDAINKPPNPTPPPNPAGRRGGNKPEERNSNLLHTQSNESSNESQRELKDKEKPRMMGRFKNAYCVFDESFGHDSSFCKVRKHDYAYELAQAQKHKLCLLCLKTSDHTLDDCKANFKSCLICKEKHHIQLHEVKDQIDALSRAKAAKKEEKKD